MKEGKSFSITQTEVPSAYKRAKANKWAGGVDGADFAKYREDIKGNLYELWNRMELENYFPKAVKVVEIPKKNGKKKLLGVSSIEDRVAQMVTKNRLEPKVEPVFYDDSYGYRRITMA